MASVVYGLLSMFVLDWRTLPAWVLPTGALGALLSTGLAVYATGGFDSPIEQVPVFVVVYSACFLSSRFTAVCAIGAVVAHELPLLYDAHARAQSVAADSLSAAHVASRIASSLRTGTRHVSPSRQNERLPRQSGQTTSAPSAMLSSAGRYAPSTFAGRCTVTRARAIAPSSRSRGSG